MMNLRLLTRTSFRNARLLKKSEPFVTIQSEFVKSSNLEGLSLVCRRWSDILYENDE